MKQKLRISVNSPVVLAFAAACFAAYLLNLVTAGLANRMLFSVYRASLLSPMTYLRCLTYVFGHASWDHLLGNMIYILLLGPILEEKYGSRTLVEVIVLTAVVTGVIQMIFFPHVTLLGASGVVFAMILLASITGTADGGIPLTFILAAVLFMGRELVDAVFVADNVSHLGHILGGLVGSAAGFLLSRGRRR